MTIFNFSSLLRVPVLTTSPLIFQLLQKDNMIDQLDENSDMEPTNLPVSIYALRRRLQFV